MNLLIMLLLLNILIGEPQTSPSTIVMNASLTYVGSAYSLVVYGVSYANSSGYIIVPQGVYEGRFAGLLRLGNFVYVGVYQGLITKSNFIGSFTPIINYEAVGVPTELLLGNYTNFMAVVQSRIPVVFRYLVFNEYGNGTMINTLPLITVNESTSLTIPFSGGYDCSSYVVNATFFTPTQIVPIPVVINQEPPITYFTSNVTIVKTSPATELMLLEPGDIVIAETPITSASYIMYVCRKLDEAFEGYNLIYAMVYLGPININVTESSIAHLPGAINNNELRAINEVFQKLVGGGYRLVNYSAGPENLLRSGKGSIMDFVTVAMYVLRVYGIPARAAFGFYGVYYNGQYIFSSSTGLLWDEAYTNGGWVMFLPTPSYGSSMLSFGYGNVLYSVIVGLILVLPWVIGYLIFVIISHVRMR